MKPIRIARIIDRLNIGGPAKHVVWLTSELNSDQYDTTLITGTVPDGEGDMSYFERHNYVSSEKHTCAPTSELNPDQYEAPLITGTVPDGEGDMSYFAHQAGV